MKRQVMQPRCAGGRAGAEWVGMRVGPHSSSVLSILALNSSLYVPLFSVAAVLVSYVTENKTLGGATLD